MHRLRVFGAALVAAGFLSACSGAGNVAPTTGPQIPSSSQSVATSPQGAPARVGTAAVSARDALATAQKGDPLHATLPVQPSSLTLTLPTPQTLTMTVARKTVVFAASTDPKIATVSPNEVDVKTITGGSGTAIFTVTPHAAGKAVIGLIDTQLMYAVVPVTVTVKAATGTMVEYAVPTAGSQPYGIAAGPDGNLWFTEYLGNRIGRITPQGVISEFSIPTASSHPWGIAAGPDGTLWFTESSAEQIGTITPGGVITEYPLPQSGVPYFTPTYIAKGSDGNLWFTQYGDLIGRITPLGSATAFQVPTANSEVLYGGITAGPDGNIWFAEYGGEKLGRITPSGTLTEFPFPFSGAGLSPDGISAGPDGNLWFTLYQGDGEIGKMTTTGTVVEYTTPTFSPGFGAITGGPDGNLWFTEYTGNKIGRITPSGTVTEFPISTSPGAGVKYGITSGPDGNLWFTELAANKIGRITP